LVSKLLDKSQLTNQKISLTKKAMKTSQLNKLTRTIAGVAFVALATAPTLHASLSANLNVAADQNLLSLDNAQQSLSQLSTGFNISSAANNGQALYIQTSPLQQSILQLFGGQQTLSQDGVAQSSLSQLSVAQQDSQPVLQLLGDQSGNKINSAQDNAAGLQLDNTQQRLSTGLRINQAARITTVCPA